MIDSGWKKLDPVSEMLILLFVFGMLAAAIADYEYPMPPARRPQQDQR